MEAPACLNKLIALVYYENRALDRHPLMTLPERIIGYLPVRTLNMVDVCHRTVIMYNTLVQFLGLDLTTFDLGSFSEVLET